MIRRLLVKILVSMVALYVANYLVTGFAVGSGLRGYVIGGVVLGLLNSLVRPVLKLIAFPLILITFGLFTIVINGFLLIAAAHLTGLIFISGITALLWSTLIISLVHIIFDA